MSLKRSIRDVLEIRPSKLARFRAPINSVTRTTRQTLRTPTSLSRHNGNRDNVPSLRPVTSANDIQIPLKRRDVRLTTFELQIAISLWLWTVDPSDSGTIDKDNSKNGRLSRVNTGTSIFHSQFKSPAQQVDCEIYEWCHCSISQMRHFDIYLDQRHDDIHLINIQLT